MFIKAIISLCLIAIATSADVTCGLKKTAKIIKLGVGDVSIFKTQDSEQFGKTVNCKVTYKKKNKNDDCTLTFNCNTFDITNTIRPKKNGLFKVDKKKYSKTNGPEDYTTTKSKMKVLFKSKKTMGSGASCIAECAAPTVTTTVAPTVGPTGGCKCGLANRSTRIVGGEETEVNEYPWQAGIVSKDSDFVWCGASVLTTKWIITAAHCTEGQSPNQIQVLLGEHDYYDGNANGKTVRKDVIEIEIHANYDSFTTDYDFSLLKLSSPIDFEANSHIRPICLPQNDANQYVDYMATVTGWGTTQAGGSTSNVLREVDVKILSNGVCSNSGYSSSGYTITQQMVCAAAASGNGGKDACQGDSGGPIVTKESGDSGTVAGENYELIGVVSWGIGCAAADFPGVYARVTEQLDWIETITSPTEASTCPRT